MDAGVWEILKKAAAVAKVDPFLAGAVAWMESSWNPAATRFEKRWKYFLHVEEFAAAFGRPAALEREQQATSWGLMQVMGSVARELGFPGADLSDLCFAPIGAHYGSLKLAEELRRWPSRNDAIAAYNAGEPVRLRSGLYKNQKYVDTVLSHEAELRRRFR